MALNALTAGAAATVDFLVDILSEVVSTIVINLLNKVEWCLNVGENVLSSILIGGAIAVIGGFLIKFVVKRLNLGGAIDNVLKKVLHKTEDGLKKTDNVVVATYKTLKKAGGDAGTEVHHIIEKRFLKTGKLAVSDAGEMLSVRLTKAQHQLYTNKWRDMIPYGEAYEELSRETIAKAARDIYKDAPDLLNAALKTIFGG